MPDITTKPAMPVRPPAPKVELKPEGYWHGEEKFRVWKPPARFQRDWDADVVREYVVFGLLAWQSGPRAAQLKLSRHWTLRMRLDGAGNPMVEAELLLYPRAAALANLPEPERGVVLTIPLSTVEEEREVRRQARYVLRLAAWAGKRLAERFEGYLKDQGL